MYKHEIAVTIVSWLKKKQVEATSREDKRIYRYLILLVEDVSDKAKHDEMLWTKVLKVISDAAIKSENSNGTT